MGGKELKMLAYIRMFQMGQPNKSRLAGFEVGQFHVQFQSGALCIQAKKAEVVVRTAIAGVC